MARPTEQHQQEVIFEDCIIHRHWMEDAPPSTPSPVSFGFVLRCAKGCGTLRHVEIHPATGHVTGSSYQHNPAYVKYRKSRGTQAVVRLEHLKALGVRKPRAKKVSK